MSLKLVVAPDEPNETVLTEGETRKLNFTRTHTGLATWRTTIDYDLSWENRVFEDVVLYEDDEMLFQGFLEVVDSNKRAGTTKIEGRGIGKKLRESGERATYSNILAHKAIEEYWTRTDFDATVIPPTARATVVDFLLTNIQSESQWYNRVSIPDDKPARVTSDGVLEPSEVSWMHQCANNDGGSPATTTSHIGMTGGSCAVFDDASQAPEYYFFMEHVVPAGSVGIYHRFGFSQIDDWSSASVAWGSTALDVVLNADLVQQYDGEYTEPYTTQEGAQRKASTVISGTNVTSEAGSKSGSSFSLLNDTLYIGSPDDVDAIEFGLSQQGAGSYTVDWQYYATERASDNSVVASEWRSIPNVTDGTANLTQSGDVTWSLNDIANDTQSGGSYVELSRTTVDGNDDVLLRAVPSGSVDTSPECEYIRTTTGPIRHAQYDYSNELESSGQGLTLNPLTSDNRWYHDIVTVYDKRYGVTADNTLDEEAGHLDAPQTMPDEVKVYIDSAAAPWNVEESRTSVVFDAGDAEQAPITLGARLSNNQWHSQTFTVAEQAGGFEFTFDHSAIPEYGEEIGNFVTMRRYDEDTDSTPLTGNNATGINDFIVEFDGNDVAFIDELTVEGDHMENLQSLHNFANMRFVIDHQSPTLQATSFRVGDNQASDPGWKVRDVRRRLDVRDYANEVTIRGALQSDNTRPTRTQTSPGEIDANGIQHYDVIDPRLNTQRDVDSVARKELGNRLAERQLSGTLWVDPIALEPGRTYTVKWSEDDTSNVPLEEVVYTVSAENLEGVLRFDIEAEIAEAIASVRNEVSQSFQSI